MAADVGLPPVAVVVVAYRPGPWFEEALEALAAQDYSALSVLVVVVGGPADEAATAARVAAVLPEAHLASVPGGTGFGEAANRGVSMVSGVAHVLVCHDDVALAPSAVRLLLEEAYRSNAGLTCPKAVEWEDPQRLVSVGLGADRLGVARPLVEPGELDQGQHDAVREVFVASGGAVLARTDLWSALGGHEPGCGAPAGELEMSWRAQLAGARVVVAPQAVARHLGATGRGLRTGPDGQVLSVTEVEHHRARLRALWTCYSSLWLLFVAPVALVFLAGQSLWALAGRRDGARAAAPWLGLWRSLGHPAQLRRARRGVRRLRRVSDFALWRSPSRGGARMRSVLRPHLERRGGLAAPAAPAAPAGPEPPGGAGEPARVPRAGADLSPGRRGPAPAAAPQATPASRQARGAAAVALALLVVVGSRGLLGGGAPTVGQLPSLLGGPAGWLHSWWSGAGPAGLGGAAWSAPAWLLLWALGVVCLGSADAAVHLVVLAPLLLGPVGATRFAKRLVPGRGRFLAGALYASSAVAYDALAQGQLGALVVYGAAPWVLAWLVAEGGGGPSPEGTRPPAGWSSLLRRAVVLAPVAALAPSLVLLVPLLAVALAAGYRFTGGAGPHRRLLWAPAAVAAGATALLSPWSWSTLSSWSALTGAPVGRALGVKAVLALHAGPYGGGPLGLALVVAAVVPLLIARSWRLSWSGRLWVVALACMALEWALSRSGAPPQAGLLLAPAAACLAVVASLGVAAARSDLREARFGWRQLGPAVSLLAAAGCALPVLSWAAGGRWSVPVQGASAAFPFPSAAAGDYRVLWLGPAQSLPLSVQGWSGTTAFAASLDGVPTLAQQWPGPGGAGGRATARELSWAVEGATSELGRLLGLQGVRYIAVATAGTSGAGGAQAEAAVLGALGRQVDLVPVGTSGGYSVFYNADWLPLVSLVPHRATGWLAGAGRAEGSGWQAASLESSAPWPSVRPLRLGGPAASWGQRRSGQGGAYAVYAGVPPGRLVVRSGGRALTGVSAGAVGSLWYAPAQGGAPGATVVGASPVATRVADLAWAAMWVLALGACSGLGPGRRGPRPVRGLLPRATAAAAGTGLQRPDEAPLVGHRAG